MRLRTLLASLSVVAALAVPAAFADTPTPAGPQPLTLADAIAWKGVRGSALSPDGQWLAYRLAPAEGDGELVLRNIPKGEEKRFPVGESRAPTGRPTPGGVTSDIVFSDDSKWLTFPVAPTAAQKKAAGSGPQRAGNKLVLLELATGTKQEFEKVRRSAFAPEGSGWLALHREAESGPAGPPAPDKAIGTDLILRELATGSELNIGNVAEFAFDKKGQWLAFVIDANGQAGNGVQLRHLADGVQTTLDSGKANYKGLTWAEKGDAFAVLKGVEDKAYEGKLYSVLGFTDLGEKPVKKVVYDPQSDTAFPGGMTVSPNRNPAWTDDGDALVFGIHEAKKKTPEKPGEAKPAPDRKPEPAKITNANSDDEGDSDYQPPRQPTPRGARSAGGWRRPGQARPRHLALAGLAAAVEAAGPGRARTSSSATCASTGSRTASSCGWPTTRSAASPWRRSSAGRSGIDNQSYQLGGSLDGKHVPGRLRHRPADRRAEAGGQEAPRRASTCRPTATPPSTTTTASTTPTTWRRARRTCLTGTAPTRFVDEEDDHNVDNPPTPMVGWAADGKSVLLSDGWDIWKCPRRGWNGRRT